VRSIVDIEVQMTAVQRIHEYCTIASERQSSSGNCSFNLSIYLIQLLLCFIMNANVAFCSFFSLNVATTSVPVI